MFWVPWQTFLGPSSIYSFCLLLAGKRLVASLLAAEEISARPAAVEHASLRRWFRVPAAGALQQG